MKNRFWNWSSCLYYYNIIKNLNHSAGLPNTLEDRETYSVCNFETILLSDKGEENIYSLPKDIKQLVKNIQGVLFSE